MTKQDIVGSTDVCKALTFYGDRRRCRGRFSYGLGALCATCAPLLLGQYAWCLPIIVGSLLLYTGYIRHLLATPHSRAVQVALAAEVAARPSTVYWIELTGWRYGCREAVTCIRMHRCDGLRLVVLLPVGKLRAIIRWMRERAPNTHIARLYNPSRQRGLRLASQITNRSSGAREPESKRDDELALSVWRVIERGYVLKYYGWRVLRDATFVLLGLTFVFREIRPWSIAVFGAGIACQYALEVAAGTARQARAVLFADDIVYWVQTEPTDSFRPKLRSAGDSVCASLRFRNGGKLDVRLRREEMDPFLAWLQARNQSLLVSSGTSKAATCGRNWAAG